MKDVYVNVDKDLLQMIERINHPYVYDKYGELISIENVISMLEDVVYEYDKLQESFEDYKQYVKDNFKQISDGDLFDVQDKDFI